MLHKPKSLEVTFSGPNAVRLHELLLSQWITHSYPAHTFASSLYSLHKSHLCVSFSKKKKNKTPNQTVCFEPLQTPGFQMISELWRTESIPSPAATPWPKHCTLPRHCCRFLPLPSSRLPGCTRPQRPQTSVSGAGKVCTNPGEALPGQIHTWIS